MPTSIRPHLLVVDDDRTLCETLAIALGFEYTVHTATEGTEACRILRDHPIGLIVLDAFLYGEHGFDLVPSFRALRRAPILVLTGHSDEGLAIRALNLGVEGYLKKPVDLAALQAAVERFVPSMDRVRALVAQACRRLDADLAKPIRLGEIAGQLGVSDKQLRRCFAAALDLTPGQYRTRRRMQEGARLVLTTALDVDQIAREVGFASGTAFARVFRRAYAMSPTEYRLRPPHAD